MGIDEIAWHKGHKYLTLVYDISGSVKRLLAVAENRTESSLQECLSSLGEQTCAGICYIAVVSVKASRESDGPANRAVVRVAEV